MTALIDDLLALSRVEATRPDAAADVRTAARAVEEDLSDRVKEAAGVLRVRCDEGLLREILWNLGENALKYRRRDVALEIDVVGSMHRSRYELSVSDRLVTGT